MSDGYFRLHRSVMNHYLFGSGRLSEREAWIWLIAEASYRDHKVRWRNQMIDIKRGQVPTSYRKMADSWGWSVNRVVNFLKLLKNEKMVDTATDTGFLVITVCNYEKYQSSLTNSDTQSDTQSNTLTDTATDTNRIKGKERKEKEEKTEKGTAFAAPDWLSPEIWQGFVDHRQRIRKPMTDRAKRLIVTELEGLRRAGHDPNECLDRSIAAGWAGVFPPKPDGAAGRPAETHRQPPKTRRNVEIC